MSQNINDPFRPLVSVIMPAYNSAKFINESIEAVLTQTYPNIEIIIVNDGSTDDTAKKIASFGGKVISIETENKGVSAARNLAIDNSSGSWIAFCDADDIWFPEKLELQMIKTKGFLWSYTDSYYYGAEYEDTTKRSDLSKLRSGDIFDELTIENTITTSSVLVSKQVLLNNGKFNEHLIALEDWELWLKIAKNLPISYINKPLLKYRVYPNSTSRKAREMLPLHMQIIKNIFKENYTQKGETKAIIKAYIICSYIAEQGSDFSFALKCTARAFMLAPTDHLVVKRLLACTYRLVTNSIFKSSKLRNN